jgi:uncharacterized membrane protein YkvA (DUF1232 family)
MIAMGGPEATRSAQKSKWKQGAAFLIGQARTLVFVIGHRKVPWLARLSSCAAVAYLFSPIQLIPTFIPVIGQLDDLAVLYIGMKIARKVTPPRVFAECQARAFRSMANGVERAPSESRITAAIRRWKQKAENNIRDSIAKVFGDRQQSLTA